MSVAATGSDPAAYVAAVVSAYADLRDTPLCARARDISLRPPAGSTTDGGAGFAIGVPAPPRIHLPLPGRGQKGRNGIGVAIRPRLECSRLHAMGLEPAFCWNFPERDFWTACP